MSTKSKNSHASDFPKIGAPATRALNGAGYFRLEHLTTISENEIAQFHGVGPAAIELLRDALQAIGLSFASERVAKK